MIVNVGSWTDDANYVLGGYFGTDLDAELFVALDTTADWTVKRASTSADILIGKMISQPSGEHTASGARATILMFGDMISEVEIDTASDVIAVGDSVIFSAKGGSFSAGVWKKATATSYTLTGTGEGTSSFYNGTVVLATTSASGSIASGTTVPVLFGHQRMSGPVTLVIV
jgi:hypothetical protein